MQLSPVQSLVLLVLAGLAISGWLYGLHWKRVASGDSFTKEERIMIQLQDQIEVLTRKNEELNQALRDAEGGESSSEAAPVPASPPEDPIELPTKEPNGPL